MRVKALLLAGLVAAVAAPAFAADLPPVTEPPIVEPFPPAKASGGWYLRGDIGYSITADYDGWSNIGGHTDIYNEDYEDGFWIGGGVGYRWNDWFRTDLTVEYRHDADYTGLTACGACAYTENSSSISTWLFLANAYVDLGNYYGLSPYVGAGAGFAYHNIDTVNGVNRLSDGSLATPAYATPIASGSSTSFAVAAYAGMTYHFTENLALDANYRYLWMGDLESGYDGFGGQVFVDDITTHDFRVGMRYEFH